MKSRFCNRIAATAFAAGACVLFSTPSYAFICTYVVNDPVIVGALGKDAAATSAVLDTEIAVSSGVVTSVFERLVAATKVQTAQRSADASRNAIGIRKAMQAYSSVVNQQAVAEDVLQAQREFGDESHIASACAATAVLGDVTRAISSVPDLAKNMISPKRISTAPGGTMTPREAVKKRLSGHLSKYCSKDEAKAGLCSSAGSQASADVDAATIFNSASSQDAADAYINNLAGDPIDKPTATESKTPSGALRMATSMRMEAIRSPALASLAVLRAQQAGGSGAGLSSQSNVTMKQALDEIMSQYGGGPKYKQWDAEISATDQQGVLRELVKLRALAMKLRSYQTQSTTRIGTMIASLLAAEAEDRN